MNHPLEEVFSQAGVQSSEEIIERFKKVFGKGDDSDRAEKLFLRPSIVAAKRTTTNRLGLLSATDG